LSEAHALSGIWDNSHAERTNFLEVAVSVCTVIAAVLAIADWVLRFIM
jgi:hypothetical protein